MKGQGPQKNSKIWNSGFNPNTFFKSPTCAPACNLFVGLNGL